MAKQKGLVDTDKRMRHIFGGMRKVPVSSSAEQLAKIADEPDDDPPTIEPL
jgi:hypothetical protein